MTSQQPIVLDQQSFLLGCSCPRKLYYKHTGYPRNVADEPLAEYLAAERQTVVELARRRFPDGIGLDRTDVSRAGQATRALLETDHVTVFDAVFIRDGLKATADLVRRRGSRLEVCLVKATSARWSDFVSGCLFLTTASEIRADWRSALNEATFVTNVVRAAYPDCEVATYLLMPDQDRAASVDGLPGLVAGANTARGRGVLGRFLLSGYDVSILCEKLRPSVWAKSRELARQTVEGTLPSARLSYACKHCEFRVGGAAPRDGFRECWGPLAEPSPHLFDLFQLWSVRDASRQRPLADDLIAAGKTSLFDLPDEALVGKHGARQRLQIRVAKSQEEWLDPELPDFLSGLERPLHFLDFETLTPAVPHHRGMFPFEVVAFQWSCHSATQSEGPLRHREWLNDEISYPHLAFLRGLREALAEGGTVFVWTNHEVATLRAVAKQLGRLHPEETDLIDWVTRLTDGGRIVDLNAVCQRAYLHPQNEGRSSLKKVLPPVFRANAELRRHPWLAGLRHASGEDPYEALPTATIAGKTWAVRDGCGALRAYRELLFGAGRAAPETREQLRALLLRYCQLDTLALAAVYAHWVTHAAKPKPI